MFIFAAPLLMESTLSSVPSTIIHLREFNLNITVSGSDIGEHHLIWNPGLGIDRTESDKDVSKYVRNDPTLGDFHYGQKEAVVFAISPEANYPIFCNDSTYFNGNYTFLVQEGQLPQKRKELWSFYVDIRGRSKKEMAQ